MPYENDPNIVPTATLGQEPVGGPPVTDTGKPAGEQPAQKEPEPILGKYKSVDELISAHQELEKTLGKQGAELGDLRKQNEIYGKALESVQKTTPQKTETTQTRDFNAELTAIEKKAEAGEISFGESIRLAAQITEEKTLARARDEYRQFDSERQTQTAEQQFLKQNPDFQDVLKSGVLDPILEANPLYNNLNAYQAYKAQQREAELTANMTQAEKAAYEKGKAEIGSLAEGAKVADTVLSKPGTAMREGKPAKTLDEHDIKQGMLAALDKARGG